MEARTLYQTPDFELAIIGEDRLPQITRFVFGIYDRLFRKMHGWQGLDLDTQIEADLAEADRTTIMAAFARNGDPLATIRMLERADRPLPIEKDFGIDVPVHLSTIGHSRGLVVEAGRFARRQARKGSKARTLASKAMQAVLGAAIMYSTAQPETLLYATLDNQVLTLLQSRGFPFESLAPARMYLGSPTTPVFVKADDWVALQQQAA